MTLYGDQSAGYNLGVNYNQIGADSGAAAGVSRFMANMGSFMCRCIPFFILSLLGINTNSGKKS